MSLSTPLSSSLEAPSPLSASPISSPPSRSWWLSLFSYLSPLSWIDYFFSALHDTLPLEGHSKSYPLSPLETLTLVLPLTEPFQHHLQRLCREQRHVKIEIEVKVVKGHISSLTLGPSDSTRDRLIELHSVNEGDSVTLILDRVNTHFFAVQTWHMCATATSSAEHLLIITGSIVTYSSLNEKDGVTLQQRKQHSARLLHYGLDETENQQTKSTEQPNGTDYHTLGDHAEEKV